MDLILELMSRASMLIYEENQLMKMVNKNADLSFINGAEEGRDIEEYNLTRKNDIDLFNKRKEIFAINNKISDLLQGLTSEEKEVLAEKIELMVEEHIKLYVEKFNAYQKIIDEITKPNFSFDNNNEYKEMLVSLKEQFNRHQTAADYLKHMSLFVNPRKRGSK